MTIANALLRSLLVLVNANRSRLHAIYRRRARLAAISWGVVNDMRYQTAGPAQAPNNCVRRHALRSSLLSQAIEFTPNRSR